MTKFTLANLAFQSLISLSCSALIFVKVNHWLVTVLSSDFYSVLQPLLLTPVFSPAGQQEEDSCMQYDVQCIERCRQTVHRVLQHPAADIFIIGLVVLNAVAIIGQEPNPPDNYQNTSEARLPPLLLA